ncbi:MAG: hypothetical protein DMG49_03060 [Acidobacteria bacterium]|nr:MAG: hypothetical protein DMG49_03060 [Acidobacteriota bacterium]
MEILAGQAGRVPEQQGRVVLRKRNVLSPQSLPAAFITLGGSLLSHVGVARYVRKAFTALGAV